MANMGWSLLLLYLTVASAYGGWQGRDLSLRRGVWWLLLPPIAWAAVKVVGEWRRNPEWGSIRVCLVMAVIGAACLGGTVLGLAWVVAEATGRWSVAPAVRAMVGGGLGAAGGGLALLAALSPKGAAQREAGRAEDPGRPAAPGTSTE